MSCSNCCFLTCIQISQEADQVVWYSHLFQNFPQFIVIHTVKGFGIVNKVDVFLELSCFFDDPADVGTLISGSSAFSKTSLNSGSSLFTYCWSLAWRILSITSVWDACNCAVVWAFFGIAFLWDWTENGPFPVLLGFSYLGRGLSLHSCSNKAQPLLLTLDEGYLLTAIPPDLECGVAPLGPPAPVQLPLLGPGVAPLGCRPWPQVWGSSFWPPPLTSDVG